MENSIYIGLSRQITLQRNMEIIANNVANMNTTGFRAQNLIFDEYISDPGGKEDPISMVINSGQYQNTQSGAVKFTGNDFDVALNGPGFMGVNGPAGDTVYTRAGNLQMAADGTLMTASGHVVAGDGGSTITIPAGSTRISIDERGRISNQDGEIGRLMIVEFENLQSLKPLGDNLYSTNATTKQAEETRVMQGSIEGSNVNGILEMTRLIETSRKYQSVHKMISSENERLRNAINKLTKV